MPPAFGQDAELFESDPVFPSDSRILEIAREEAEAWLAKDPDLTSAASRRLRATLEDRWAGRLELARVG
jgi:hypothetical protein